MIREQVIFPVHVTCITKIRRAFQDIVKNFPVMRTWLLLSFVFLFLQANAQPLTVRVEPVQLPFFTGIQSYVWGQYNDHLVVIGGRLDGLHKRRPFESFPPSDNNAVIYVYERVSGESYTADVKFLPAPLNDQLQSSNMEFYQDGEQLVIVGGYGYSVEAGTHTTYPVLTVVDLPCLIRQLKEGADPNECFISVMDDRMAVTGGQLSKLDDGRFYLVGGQLFDGLYNPMGPTHGPGFTQIYTDEIRRFRLVRDGATLRIQDYEAWHDELNLHRRDYNLTRVLRADGSQALIAFSGVFQRMVDLPFLNAVVIDTSGYRVDNDFSQYFNQYHTAHVAIHDAARGENHVVFLGGIAQFYIDEDGKRVEDQEVPFVKTISGVTMDADGGLNEWLVADTMPGYLGASAEFIPNREFVNDLDMIVMDAWEPGMEYLLGYVIGGILSEVDNAFFLNGDFSSANTQIYAVYGRSGVTPTKERLRPVNPLVLTAWPNPANGHVNVSIEVPDAGKVYFYLQDTQGRVIYDWESPAPAAGKYETRLALPDVPAGSYILAMSFNYYMRSIQVNIQP